MRNAKVQWLVKTAMLGAVAAVLMLLSFPIPLMPSFIKLDFSELPALIASFIFGPLSGAVVCFIKNLLNLIITGTTTGGVGELSNFILGVCFVVPAGLVYKRRKNRVSALIGSLAGAAMMTGVSVLSNYYIIYPIYEKLIMPMEAILDMYRAINPSVQTLWEAILLFNMPFTFAKGMCSVVMAFIIYKPLSRLFKAEWARKGAKGGRHSERKEG